MTYRIKRIVSVLCLVAALGAAALLPASGYCENLRFVFLADSRNDHSLTDPINTAVLNAIIAQIQTLSPQPAFVIFGGDMAYRGCIGGIYQFQAFKNLFAPLGIPLYTAIGNHELYDDHSSNGFLLANQQQFQQVFSENPANGPQGYIPSYDHLVYSFESSGGDAFFAVLDPYFLTADVPTEDVKLGGTIDYAQLDWLSFQAAQTQATHKFLFIHTPYYYVTGGTPDEKSAADVTFSYLWSILDNTRFNFYACGHSHLYSRKTIDSSIAPFPQPSPDLPQVLPWKNNVVQLLCGTCGADVDTTTPTVDPSLWHISQLPDTYYFSVVDIKGRQVTVTSYSGNTGTYNVFDSFTLHSPLSAIDSLLLD